MSVMHNSYACSVAQCIVMIVYVIYVKIFVDHEYITEPNQQKPMLYST